MKTPTILIVAMLMLAGFAHAKPNIIFIMTDDQGYGDLGCCGAEKIKTPNIDRLCAEGMKFNSISKSTETGWKYQAGARHAGKEAG